MDKIYILNKDGEPLMPSTRWRHIKKQLKEGKAIKLSSKPFVVQLLYEVPNIVQTSTPDNTKNFATRSSKTRSSKTKNS